jgi:hypothetical protein
MSVLNSTTPVIKTKATVLPATRALLAAGLLAGPVYVGVGLVHALNRPGFDLTRHALSLLSNGPLGWIHITTLVASGLLTLAGAVGLRRALRGTRGGTWGALLLAVYGLSLVAAGFFVADPAQGFPPGTPAEANAVSWHGLLHFISGGAGFLALIAAAFVFARRFAAAGERLWAGFSALTGLFFFAAFFGIASGSGSRALNVVFGLAVVLAWAWLSALHARVRAALSATR